MCGGSFKSNGIWLPIHWELTCIIIIYSNEDVLDTIEILTTSSMIPWRHNSTTTKHSSIHNTIFHIYEKASEARVSMLTTNYNECEKVRVTTFLLSRTLKHQRLLRKRRKVHLRVVGRHVLA
jgi:hypothetical protein